MARRTQTSVFAPALVAGVLAAAVPAAAADWRGLVIGQSGPGADRAFADAFHATAALAQQGGRDVLMLRDTTRAAIETALAAWPEGTDAVVWLSGPAQDGALALPDGPLPLSQVLALLAGRGVGRVALMVEDCSARDGTALALNPGDAPPGLRLLLAASAGPGGACPADGGRLTDRLRRAPATASLQAALAGLDRGNGSMDIPVPLSEAPAALAAPVAPVPDSPAAGALVLPGASAAQVAVVVPVLATAVPLSSPVGPAVLSGGDLAALPATGREARPVRPGLPQPSIIIGLIGGVTQASLTQPDAPATPDLRYDDVAGRAALRAQSPDLFATLVASGALDPPEGQLAAAIQTELQRMGCYRSGIDGVWGTGSRAAVERYFDQRPEARGEGVEPTAGLFRQIIAAEDVTCPAPATAAASPRAPSPQTRTTTAPAAPRVTQPARPQPAQPTLQPRLSTGIFR